jgi:hypothetical protein
MTHTLLALVLVLAADGGDAKPRKSSGIAPSLPALTREEEAKIDAVVDRLIRADTGRLQGFEKSKAFKDFDALKAEAIPALIRGLNRSAKLNYSCPVLLIGKKLDRLLMASDDPVLLEFARDEIGADVGRSLYSGTLQGLRLKCSMRKNALARLAPRRPARPRGPAGMTTEQLAKAAGSERGPKLHGVLTELAKRTGKEVLPALAAAAESYEKDTQNLGRDLLDRRLGQLPEARLLEKLADDAAEVRKSAVRLVGARHPRRLDRVIDRLTDEDAQVRAEAHAVLVKHSKGEDFGPADGADRAAQQEAQKKWRAWQRRQAP